jgi:tRNA/rRNA methyltransferase
MWPPIVVCHQLKFAENLGAIARVMANFGLQQLRLSSPVLRNVQGAEKTAIRADEVISRLLMVDSLRDALGDAVFTVGTSSRSNVKRLEVVTPSEGVELLRKHSQRGPVALLFGGEMRGLSDEELEHCQAAVAIETESTQPSMNVAQAVAVMLYLCRTSAPVPAAKAESPGASAKLLKSVEDNLREVLTLSEFVNPQAPNHALVALLRTLVRNGLSQEEAALWNGALVHVRRHLK